MIASHTNILMLISRRIYTKPRDKSQAMKWKRRLNITWNLSITITTGFKKYIEIDKLLINFEYIYYFIFVLCNGAKTMVLLHPY